MADSFGLDAPLAKEQHFGLDAPIVSLGDVAAPDVFTEGAAQAAATPTPLAPQLAGIGRGIVGAGEAGLNLGTQIVSPVVAGLGGLTALGTNALGLTNANPADVVQGVSDTLNYRPQTEAGQIATEAATYPFQKLAEAGRFAGEHVQDATGSPLLATGVDTAINALPILAGLRGAREAAVRSPEPVIAETPPVDTTRIEVQPPPVPLESQGPSPVPTGVTEATPLEQLNARPEVPPEVPVGNTGERAAAPVDGQGEVASAEGAPPANWVQHATTQIDGLPKDDGQAAWDVATVAERAEKSGLTPEDIYPFHDETDAEYTDRITNELTAYEEKNRGTEPTANAADNRQDVQQATGAPVEGGEPEANAAPAENQATGNVPRSQAEPAAAAGGDTEVLDHPAETPQKTVATSVGDRGVNTSYDVPLLGSSLKDGTVVLDKDWNPVIPDGQLKGLDRTPFIVEHEATERQHEDAGMDYTQAHQLAETAEHAKLLDHLGLKADTPEADAAIKAYEDSYKPDLIAAARKKNPQTAPDMLEKPYQHPENQEQRRMLAEVNANEGKPASITKATVEASREERGKPQIEPERTTNEDALAEAQRRIAADPTIARRTTDELIANPEAADPVKKAILAHDRQRIETDLRQASDEVAKATNEDSRAAAVVKRDLADLDLELNDQASRATGTASGQSLQAQKIAVLPDYTLGKVLTAAKEANKGTLPEPVRADLEAATARIKELEDQLAKKQAKQEKQAPQEPKKTPDEKMQAKLVKEVEKLEGQIKQRLSACPI